MIISWSSPKALGPMSNDLVQKSQDGSTLEAMTKSHNAYIIHFLGPRLQLQRSHTNLEKSGQCPWFWSEFFWSYVFSSVSVWRLPGIVGNRPPNFWRHLKLSMLGCLARPPSVLLRASIARQPLSRVVVLKLHKNHSDKWWHKVFTLWVRCVRFVYLHHEVFHVIHPQWQHLSVCAGAMWHLHRWPSCAGHEGGPIKWQNGKGSNEYPP